MLKVQFKSVLTLLILAVAFANALKCRECTKEVQANCEEPKDCPGGKVPDVCRCCERCAKVKKETCGGPWKMYGECDKGLVCKGSKGKYGAGKCKGCVNFNCKCTPGFSEISFNDRNGCRRCKCVANRPSQAKRDPCKMAKYVGPCRAAFPRWHFDDNTNSCKMFIYGGCQGNKNNFHKKSACEKRCKKGNTCDLNKDVGPCKAKIPRYYYEKISGSCVKFYYGGCRGNKNNFSDQSACEVQCKNSRF